MSFSFSMMVDDSHTGRARASLRPRETAPPLVVGPAAVATFRLPLTGSRLSKIQMLRWDCVKDDCIELLDAKSGSQKVPLRPERVPGSRSSSASTAIPGSSPASLRHARPVLQRPWQRIRENAGLKQVRLHDLLHSFASRALPLGETRPVIGKLLGHSDIETTARYAHLARDSIHDAAERIADSIATDIL